MDSLNKFIGKGITFPIKLAGGKPILNGGQELINSSLKIILSWPILNRLFMGDFGSLIDSIIEEPNTPELRRICEELSYEAIIKYEKRIKILDIRVRRINDTKVSMELTYIIKGSDIKGSLTYPYYKTITN